MLVLKLALRNLYRNFRRTLLTVLSMSVGYIVLVATLSLSEGSYSNTIRLFTEQQTGDLQVHADNYLARPGLHKVITDVDSISPAISLLPQVVSVSPRIYSAVLAYGESKSYPAQLVGLGSLRDQQLLQRRLSQGQVAGLDRVDTDQRFGLIVGQNLARQLRLGMGNEIVLISEGLDGSIANDLFYIAGIVDAKHKADATRVYLSLPVAQEFLTMGQSVHQLVVRLQSPDGARDIAKRLNGQFDQRYRASPWQEIEETFYNSMQADKQGGHFAIMIVMLIVSVGVLNTILMSVLERVREFGVIMALGTPVRQVAALIITESMLLALAACILGGLIALPANLYLQAVGIPLSTPVDMGGMQLAAIKGEVSVLTMIVPMVVVIVSTLLVACYPAYKISRLSPLTAMQAV